MCTPGRTSKLLVGLAVALLQSDSGNAQIQSNVTCASTFSWAANSLNQSPCLVAAYLQGACSSGVWTTPALPHLASDTQLAYNAPDSSSRNLCTCSWAVYNLISACGACQNEAWRQWSDWIGSCQTTTDNLISTQAFPPSVPAPPGTAIPEYAAKDPSTWTGGLFNATEARVIGSHNIQITTSGSSSPTYTSPTTSTTSPASYDGGPEVGPIVAGVVGGLFGLLLIAALAAFLLCPAHFRRGKKTGVEYPSMKQDIHSITSTSQMQPVGGMESYKPSTELVSSQQGLIAPGPTRPPYGPRFTSSEYSFSTSVDHHSATSSMALQPIQQAATISGPYNQPPGPTQSPPKLKVYTIGQETSINDHSTNPSVRSIFTRALPCHGHAHTPSDTSMTTVSSVLPRIQQGIWRQQSGSGSNMVVPYITPSAASTSSTDPSQYPVDRKARPTGLQYTPPLDAGSFSPQGESSVPSEASTINIGMSPTRLPPGAFISTPTTTENIIIPSSLITDGEIEGDRQTNMSPANASSILEAAPPYGSDEHRDLGRRGGIPLRRTPRLPDVDEYPEEKARFTNAAAVDRPT